MLPNYFGYIFVHLRQKARLRPELSPKFLSTLGPNSTQKGRPDLQVCHALLHSNPYNYNCVFLRTNYTEETHIASANPPPPAKCK